MGDPLRVTHHGGGRLHGASLMANNLHVSYDLNSPGQNYEAVIERIKKLGSWAKIHYSFW
jgi:hypothetical protein